MQLNGTAGALESVVGLFLVGLAFVAGSAFLGSVPGLLRRRQRPQVYFILAVVAGITALVVAVVAHVVYQEHSGLLPELLIPNNTRIEQVSLVCQWLATLGGGATVVALVILGRAAQAPAPLRSAGIDVREVVR